MKADIPIVCALISSFCSVVWIVNQLCWYFLFKKHFQKQEELFDLNVTLLQKQEKNMIIHGRENENYEN